MAEKTYTTVLGDTWDSIAYNIYGDEKYMSYLIQANLPLLDVLKFSHGTVLNIPDLPEELDEDLPDWRKEE